MNISDMSLEELQDYCLKQSSEIESLKSENAEKDKKLSEVNDLNHQLQQRNNALFRQVEQGINPDNGDSEPPAEEIKSCEEFAQELKGVIRQ